MYLRAMRWNEKKIIIYFFRFSILRLSEWTEKNMNEFFRTVTQLKTKLWGSPDFNLKLFRRSWKWSLWECQRCYVRCKSRPRCFPRKLFLFTLINQMKSRMKKLLRDQKAERQPETQPINQLAEEHQGTVRLIKCLINRYLSTTIRFQVPVIASLYIFKSQQLG